MGPGFATRDPVLEAEWHQLTHPTTEELVVNIAFIAFAIFSEGWFLEEGIGYAILEDMFEQEAADVGEATAARVGADAGRGGALRAGDMGDGAPSPEEATSGGRDSFLNRFGNRTGPRPARPGDFQLEGTGRVGPYAPVSPKNDPEGASVWLDPNKSGLSGHYYRIPADTPLPDGLGLHFNGEEAGGDYPEGHAVIYPTREMDLQEFQGVLSSLPWEYGGRYDHIVERSVGTCARRRRQASHNATRDKRTCRGPRCECRTRPGYRPKSGTRSSSTGAP